LNRNRERIPRSLLELSGNPVSAGLRGASKCLSKNIFFVKHYIGISKTIRQSMSPLSPFRMAICRRFKKGGVEMKNATKVLVFLIIAAIVTVPFGSPPMAQEENAPKETLPIGG